MGGMEWEEWNGEEWERERERDNEVSKNGESGRNGGEGGGKGGVICNAEEKTVFAERMQDGVKSSSMLPLLCMSCLCIHPLQKICC
jgi:hypothetical protein